jgi:hypothetical protein
VQKISARINDELRAPYPNPQANIIPYQHKNMAQVGQPFVTKELLADYQKPVRDELRSQRHAIETGNRTLGIDLASIRTELSDTIRQFGNELRVAVSPRLSTSTTLHQAITMSQGTTIYGRSGREFLFLKVTG